MKQIIIKQNDANQRLDKFLLKYFKSLPKSLLYKSIRKKNIKLNSKPCKNNTLINTGDIIEIYLPDSFLLTKFDLYDKFDFMKAPIKLNIVYEDENIIILDKPVGLLTHPDKNYHFDSLLSRLYHYLYNKNEYNPEDTSSFSPAFVNRLDRNTGGLVVAGKNIEALRILNLKIKEHQISKFYLAQVFGHMKHKESTLIANIEKNNTKNKVKIYTSKLDLKEKNEKSIKQIITKYKVLSEFENSSLLEIQLITGRTHQIRAHFAFLGHPLLGDTKYSDKNNKSARFDPSCSFRHQALYAYKLNFNFKTNAGLLNYLNNQSFEGNIKKSVFKNLY